MGSSTASFSPTFLPALSRVGLISSNCGGDRKGLSYCSTALWVVAPDPTTPYYLTLRAYRVLEHCSTAGNPFILTTICEVCAGSPF